MQSSTAGKMDLIQKEMELLEARETEQNDKLCILNLMLDQKKEDKERANKEREVKDQAAKEKEHKEREDNKKLENKKGKDK